MILTADLPLAHGWTLADLNRIAHASAYVNRTMATDPRDLIDTAWSAIAEHLYTADTPPTEHDLFTVGRAAIWAIAKSHRTTYGYRDREWDAGIASAPKFAAYWLGLSRVGHSPEEGVVERLMLPSLMAALGEPYRAAILALAACDGDRDAAAAALGIKIGAFNARLQSARHTCHRLILGGETPHADLRRLDYRRHRGEVAPCGTLAAMLRHRDRREPLCDLCAPVERAHDRDRKARWRAAR